MVNSSVAVGGPFADDGEVQLGNYQGVPAYIITLLGGLKHVIKSPSLLSVVLT